MSGRAGSTRHRLARRLARSAPLLIALAALAPAAVHAIPVLGFREEFPGVSTSSWAGGSPFSNPGSGGYHGTGDGYLLVENGFPSNLGTVSFGSEYTGNWVAAGVTQVRLWLNDVGADDPLELHFSIGHGNRFSPNANFWQYNVGFLPPHDAWAEFVVDLTSANWTRILGTGTLATALTIVDRIHLRHDPPPYAVIPNPPDAIAAGFGLDHILLTNGLVNVGAAGPVALRPVELSPPYPNPARGPVSLTLRAAEAGPVTLQIVDVAGRTLRRATVTAAGPAPVTWLWDGRDDEGRRVAPGIYRVRAFGRTGGTSRTLVRVE